MLRSFGWNPQTKAPPEAGIIPVQAPEAQEPGEKQIHKAEEGSIKCALETAQRAASLQTVLNMSLTCVLPFAGGALLC
jgi:hypothetical protein